MKKSLLFSGAFLCVLFLSFAFSTKGFGQATVISDKPDYAPRSTAVFTGAGFAPFETVQLKVKNMSYPCNTVFADSSYLPWEVVTDENGAFETNWLVCDCPGDSLKLKATGITSGLIALTYFSDANPKQDVYPLASSFAATAPANICQGSSLTLNSTWTTTTCDRSVTNGSDFNVPVTVVWYRNSSASTSGATQLTSSVVNSSTGASNYNAGTQNVPGTYYYYAIISWSASASPGCAPANSGKQSEYIQVVVSPPSVGGSVGNNQTICRSDAVQDLTLTGKTGNVIKWQKSTSSGFSGGQTTDIANTTTTLTGSTIGTLSPGTYYFRAIVQSGTCATANSSAAIITVNAAPTADIEITGPTTVCSGSTTLIKFTGPSMGVITYTVNDGANKTVTLTNGGNFTLTTDPLTAITDFSIVKVQTSDGVCEANITGKSVSVAVSPTTVAGSAAADASSVCSGTGTILRFSGNVGNVVKWQQSANNAPYADIASTAGVLNYSTGNLTQTTKFRAVVQSGVCPTANSNEVTVTIDPVSNGGTATADADVVCSGIGTNITLTNKVGNVVKWQQHVDATDWTDIPSTENLTQLSTGTLTEFTAFRAVVQSGSCDVAYSNEVDIDVSAVSVGGTATAQSASVCYQSGTRIDLRDITGSVLTWQKSVNGGAYTDIASTADLTTYITPNLIITTKFRAVVKNGVCDPAYSSEATVTVVPRSAVGTAVPDDLAVCSGSGTTIRIEEDDVTGNVTKWQYQDATGSWIDIVSTADVFAYETGNLTATTKFRVVVKNGVCPEAYSEAVTISVSEPSKGGTATPEETEVCSGTGTTINLTGTTGDVVKWQQSVDGGAFTDIETTEGVTEYQTGNLTKTTKFRAVVQSGVCAPDNSNEVTITVDPVSDGGTASASKTILCAGEGTTISVTSTVGTIKKWEVSVNGGEWTEIPSTGGLTEISTGTLTETTAYRVLVQSGVCSADYSNEVSVTVNPLPDAQLSSSDIDNTICAGDKVTFTASGGTNYQFFVGTTSMQNGALDTYETTMLTNGQTVTVKVTNANGCIDISDGITTIVNSLPTPTFTTKPGDNVCSGVDITYTTESGQSNYVWTIPGTASTDYTITSGGTTSDNSLMIKWLTAGSKQVKVSYTNSNGCTAANPVSSTTTVALSPVPTFTTYPSGTICSNSPYTYTTQAYKTSYVWVINGIENTDYIKVSGGGTGDNSLVLKWLTPGSHTVTVNYTSGSCQGLTPASSTVTATVGALSITPLNSSNVAEQQYSDKVTFVATLKPVLSTVTPPASVDFYIGTQKMGNATLAVDPNDATRYIATLPNVALLETTFGSGVMKPGSKTATAIFIGGTGYAACDATNILNITKEDADAEYNGLTYFGTQLSGKNYSANVTLSALVTDRDDQARGDIRNAKVNFITNDASVGTINGIAVGLLDPSQTFVGQATAIKSVSLTSSEAAAGGKILEFQAVADVNCYYTGSTQGQNALITIGMSGGDFVTGGGYIKLPSTTNGSFKGKEGSRMNFGLTMKWNKSGANLQGSVNIIYRTANGKQYQIKGNAINSLSTIAVSGGQQATISTKAEFREIRNGTAYVLKGNMDLTIIAFESSLDKTGKSDKISVKLINPSGGTANDGTVIPAGLIFSNDMASNGSSNLTTLSGGKIQVRNTTSGVSSASAVDENTRFDNVAAGTFKVKLFPNPSSHLFTLDVQSSSNEPIEVKVFDLMGHMVYYHKGSLKESHHRFGQMITNGTYLAEIRQGTNRKTITLIKK